MGTILSLLCCNIIIGILEEMSKTVPAGLWFDGIGKYRNPNICNVYD
jgi:hypothetical protein